jgi:hypothetical protein
MTDRESSPKVALARSRSQQAEHALHLPFDSMKEDGSLPDKAASYVEQTFETRYIVGIERPGEDFWVRVVWLGEDVCLNVCLAPSSPMLPDSLSLLQAYFHPNNVVVVGMSRFHPFLRGRCQQGNREDRQTGITVCYETVLGCLYPDHCCTADAAADFRRQADLRLCAKAVCLNFQECMHTELACLLQTYKAHEGGAGDDLARSGCVPLRTGSRHLSDECNPQVNGKDLAGIRDNGSKMSKKVGTWTKPDTVICRISCTDESSSEPTVLCRAGLPGKFLVANTRLLEDPSLLIKRPHDEGFLFMLCMYAEDHEQAQNNLLTAEMYHKLRGTS